MASSQPRTRQTSASLAMPQSRGHIVTPGRIDDSLAFCLNCVLPILFLCGIIVLGTMLTTYTLVMRRPLPRLFTFIIVITFAVLITITFFLLVTFRVRGCQKVRGTLSEAFTGESSHDLRSSFQSSDTLLTAAQGSPAGHPSIPLKKIKCQSNTLQVTQAQDLKKGGPIFLEAKDSSHSSIQAPPSSHSIREAKVQEPLRLSTPKRLPPLLIPASDGSPPGFVPFVHETSKEAPVYYLPPGPIRPLPSAGFRPTWADDFEQLLEANPEGKGERWKFWSK